MNQRLRMEPAVLLPVAADALGVGLYTLVLPRLVVALQRPSLLNAFLIGAVYLLFCGAVYLLRRQPPRSAPAHQGLMAALGVTFSLFVTYMMADSAGFFANLEGLDPNPGVGAMVAIMVGAVLWLALIALYPTVLTLSVPQDVAATPGRHFLSLVGVNVMIVVTAAYWQVLFSGTEPYDDLAVGGKVLVFLVVYLFFLLFFAAPRLLAFLKKPTHVALLSFLLQTGYYVWRSLSQSAW